MYINIVNMTDFMMYTVINVNYEIKNHKNIAHVSLICGNFEV